MTPTHAGVLPLAVRPAFTPRVSVPVDHVLPWQRALSGAALQARDVAAAGSRASDAGNPRSFSPQLPVRTPISPLHLRDAVHFTDGTYTRGPSFDAEEAHALGALATSSVRRAAVVAADEGLTEAPAAARPARHNAVSVPPHEVHVHIEKHGEGLAVWLGLRGGDAAAPARRRAAVVEAVVRDLQERGTVLEQLTCNGEICWPPRRGKEET